MSARRRQRRQEAATGNGGAGTAAAPAWRREVALAALVFVVAVAAFASSLGNGFVYDDVDVIEKDDRLDHPLDVRTFFGQPYWGPKTEDKAAALYRPLTTWSLALDRAVLGRGPRGVHLVNVGLNGMVSVLAFLWLARLLGRRDVALVAALLFAVHPVHAEVVANGVGRSELLAAAAVLGALLLHLGWLRHATLEGAAARRRGRPWLALCLVTFLAGLFAKESAIVMPALAFLADAAVVERGRLGVSLRRLPAYALFAAPFAVFWWARTAVVGSGTPAVQEVMAHLSGGGRVLFASQILLREIGQILVPIRLCGEYSDYRELFRPSLLDPMVLASLLAWVGVAVALVQLLRRAEHALALGILWFFVAIAPTSNVLIPIGTVRAERLLFVPSLGVVLVLALLATRLGRLHRAIPVVVGVALLLAYGARTVARNADWRTGETFWRTVVRDNPGSPIAWGLLGDLARDDGHLDEAAAAFRRAIALRDGAGFFDPKAHANLGEVLGRLGDAAGAEEQYRLVLARKPEHFVSLLNLGEALLHDPARREEAVALLRRAAVADPKDFRAHANLGQALLGQGRTEEALVAHEKAVALRPDIPDLWMVKAEMEEALGRADAGRASRAEAERVRRGGGGGRGL